MKTIIKVYLKREREFAHLLLSLIVPYLIAEMNTIAYCHWKVILKKNLSISSVSRVSILTLVSNIDS